MSPRIMSQPSKEEIVCDVMDLIRDITEAAPADGVQLSLIRQGLYRMNREEAAALYRQLARMRE